MLTEEQKLFLDKHVYSSWSENDQGLINVDGNVYFVNQGYETIPVKFGSVSGDFNCSYNQLTSLEGAPKNVGGYFWCSGNQLTSLKGAPESIGGNFWCYNNQLTSLEGAPKSVGGSFYCDGERTEDKEYVLWAIKKKLN
jgi:hypothetical protein